MRNQRGITLIALVITIIVLLILAGVSIAMLTGDNGILSNADRAGRETAIVNARDDVSMTVNEAMTLYYESTYAPDDDTTEYTNLLAAIEDDTTGLGKYTGAGKTVDGATIVYTKVVTTGETADGKLVITFDNEEVATGTVNKTTGSFTWDD